MIKFSQNISIYKFSTFSNFLQGIYWIGVTDIAVEGDWIFASDSSYVNSSYWHSTEPSGKPLENCVVMRDTFMGYWDDVLCSTEAGFVCEKIDTCECLVQHVGFHCYCIEGPSIIVFYCSFTRVI